MPQMLSNLLTPEIGYRTYRIHQQALLVGLLLGGFGIYRGVDLFTLSMLNASILAPIAGFSSWQRNKDVKLPEENN